MLENVEVLLESSDRSRREKTGIRHSAAILAVTIEQLEWVLNIRTGTACDGYTWTEFSFN